LAPSFDDPAYDQFWRRSESRVMAQSLLFHSFQRLRAASGIEDGTSNIETHSDKRLLSALGEASFHDSESGQPLLEFVKSRKDSGEA
jgi:hypothetical protein